MENNIFSNRLKSLIFFLSLGRFYFGIDAVATNTVAENSSQSEKAVNNNGKTTISNQIANFTKSAPGMVTGVALIGSAGALFGNLYRKSQEKNDRKLNQPQNLLLSSGLASDGLSSDFNDQELGDLQEKSSGFFSNKEEEKLKAAANIEGSGITYDPKDNNTVIFDLEQNLQDIVNDTPTKDTLQIQDTEPQDIPTPQPQDTPTENKKKFQFQLNIGNGIVTISKFLGSSENYTGVIGDFTGPNSSMVYKQRQEQIKKLEENIDNMMDIIIEAMATLQDNISKSEDKHRENTKSVDKTKNLEKEYKIIDKNQYLNITKAIKEIQKNLKNHNDNLEKIDKDLQKKKIDQNMLLEYKKKVATNKIKIQELKAQKKQYEQQLLVMNSNLQFNETFKNEKKAFLDKVNPQFQKINDDRKELEKLKKDNIGINVVYGFLKSWDKIKENIIKKVGLMAESLTQDNTSMNDIVYDSNLKNSDKEQQLFNDIKKVNVENDNLKDLQTLLKLDVNDSIKEIFITKENNILFLNALTKGNKTAKESLNAEEFKKFNFDNLQKAKDKLSIFNSFNLIKKNIKLKIESQQETLTTLITKKNQEIKTAFINIHSQLMKSISERMEKNSTKKITRLEYDDHFSIAKNSRSWDPKNHYYYVGIDRDYKNEPNGFRLTKEGISGFYYYGQHNFDIKEDGTHWFNNQDAVEEIIKILRKINDTLTMDLKSNSDNQGQQDSYMIPKAMLDINQLGATSQLLNDLRKLVIGTNEEEQARESEEMLAKKNAEQRQEQVDVEQIKRAQQQQNQEKPIKKEGQHNDEKPK